MPPIKGLWNEVRRVASVQFSLDQFVIGALAGLGGPVALPNTAIPPGLNETKPTLRFNKGETRTAAGISFAYSLNSGLVTGRQLNEFILQRGPNASYRVIIIYYPGSELRAFVSYWRYHYFRPNMYLYGYASN